MIYLLSDKEFEGATSLGVIAISLLDVPFTCKDYDALIFTSKNGVAATHRLDESWQKLPSYAIGKGTAKAIKEYGGRVEYTAISSYGNDFAREISAKLKGKKVLFPRAKVVLSDLIDILKSNDVSIDDIIVYETTCKECKKIKKPSDGSILIFTSPSTVKCFFNCFDWNGTYKAVCIGEKTSAKLPSYIETYLPQKLTIPACIELAKTLL